LTQLRQPQHTAVSRLYRIDGFETLVSQRVYGHTAVIQDFAKNYLADLCTVVDNGAPVAIFDRSLSRDRTKILLPT